MGRYNQPTVIPYQPSFLERIAPALLQTAAQFGMQKLGQDWQASQKKIDKEHENRKLMIKGLMDNTLRVAQAKQTAPPTLGQRGQAVTPQQQAERPQGLPFGGQVYEPVPVAERNPPRLVDLGGGRKALVGAGTLVPEKPGFSLGAGQARYDASGKKIVSVPSKDQGFTLGTGQTRYDASGKKIASKPEKSLERLRQEAETEAGAQAKFAKPAALENLETIVMPDKSVRTFRRGDSKLDDAIQQGGVERVVGKTEHDVIETKEFQALREQEIATRDIFDMCDELESAAKADPTIIGFVGSSQRLIDRAASQMVAASKVISRIKPTINGKPVAESALLDPKHYNLEGFDKVAGRSAAFKSTIVRLAYVMARAQEPGGGRFSDRDVQLSLDQLAGGQGSVSQLVGALNAVRRNSRGSFNNRYRVTHGREAPADMFGPATIGSPVTAEDYLKSKGL